MVRANEETAERLLRAVETSVYCPVEVKVRLQKRIEGIRAMYLEKTHQNKTEQNGDVAEMVKGGVEKRMNEKMFEDPLAMSALDVSARLQRPEVAAKDLASIANDLITKMEARVKGDNDVAFVNEMRVHFGESFEKSFSHALVGAAVVPSVLDAVKMLGEHAKVGVEVRSIVDGASAEIRLIGIQNTEEMTSVIDGATVVLQRAVDVVLGRSV